MVFKIPFIICEPFLFLYVASFSLNDITLPQLLLEIVCKRSFNSTVCVDIKLPVYKNAQDLVQKESALWITAFGSLRSGLCVLTIPFLGPFIDAIGSRKAMFIQPIVLGVCCILYLVFTNLKRTFHPGLLLIAAPITALGGDIWGAFLVSCAYITEITPEKSRTLRLTFLDAFYCLAVGIFAFVSGYILLRFGYTGMYAISLILAILNLIYIRFFVPDPRSDQNGVVLTLPDTENSDITDPADTFRTDSPGRQSTVNLKAILSQSNPFSNYKKLALVLQQEKRSVAVVALLASSVMSLLSWSGESSIIVLYMKARPLNFDPLNVGYVLAVQCLLLAAFGYCIFNFIIQHYFSCSDFAIITVSLAVHGIYLVLLVFSISKWMVYSIQLLNAIAALDAPTLRSSLTKQVSPDSYGTILAGSTMLETIGGLIASFTAPLIYAESISFHRGAAFFFLAIFPLLGSIIIGILYCKERHQKNNNTEADIPNSS